MMKQVDSTWYNFSAVCRCGALALLLAAGSGLSAVEHRVVYSEPGRFGGWPANHGMWIWENEILVGFGAAHYADRGDRHAVDPGKPEEHLLARSLDAGESWVIEDPAKQGALLPRGAMLHGTEPHALPPLRRLEAPIDFTHPDLALTFRMEDHRGGGKSRFYFSYDRGRTWEGAFELPLFGTPGIAARSDYLVDGPRELTLFLTAGKANGREGRTLAVRTEDGGVSWRFLSWIGEEPRGFRIMPSTVRLDSGALYTTTRARDGADRRIEAYVSEDNGLTWTLKHARVAETGRGNPPSLLKLQDGRLALIYGYREAPYGIRARLSADQGETWGEEIVLRDDAAGWDLGYPISVQRPDGKIVSVYYYFDREHGPERHIAATIWDPADF